MKKLLKQDRNARFEYKVYGQLFNGEWVVFHGSEVEWFVLATFSDKASMINFLMNHER